MVPRLRYLRFAAQRHRGVEELLPHGIGNCTRRCYLDDLLALALQAAFAIPDMRDGARTVAHDLHFDVARRGKEFFRIEIAVAESLERFAASTRERFFEFVYRMDKPHAASAAARDRLQHDGRTFAEAFQERCRVRDLDAAFGAVERRDAKPCGERTRFRLVAEESERCRIGSDKGDVGRRDCAREHRVLAEEAIARMDGVALPPLSRAMRDDLRRHRDTRRLREPLEAHGLVGLCGYVTIARRLRRRLPPSRCPFRRHCAQCGWRSRRDWRSGASFMSIRPIPPSRTPEGLGLFPTVVEFRGVSVKCERRRRPHPSRGPSRPSFPPASGEGGKKDVAHLAFPHCGEGVVPKA